MHVFSFWQILPITALKVFAERSSPAYFHLVLSKIMLKNSHIYFM